MTRHSLSTMHAMHRLVFVLAAVFAAPVWCSGHGHGHARRTGSLLSYLRHHSDDALTIQREKTLREAMACAVGAALKVEISQPRSGDGSMTAPLREVRNT